MFQTIVAIVEISLFWTSTWRGSGLREQSGERITKQAFPISSTFCSSSNMMVQLTSRLYVYVTDGFVKVLICIKNQEPSSCHWVEPIVVTILPGTAFPGAALVSFFLPMLAEIALLERKSGTQIFNAAPSSEPSCCGDWPASTAIHERVQKSYCHLCL